VYLLGTLPGLQFDPSIAIEFVKDERSSIAVELSLGRMKMLCCQSKEIDTSSAASLSSQTFSRSALVESDSSLEYSSAGSNG
jgi:hypothetical protein